MIPGFRQVRISVIVPLSRKLGTRIFRNRPVPSQKLGMPILLAVIIDLHIGQIAPEFLSCPNLQLPLTQSLSVYRKSLLESMHKLVAPKHVLPCETSLLGRCGLLCLAQLTVHTEDTQQHATITAPTDPPYRPPLPTSPVALLSVLSRKFSSSRLRPASSRADL